MSDSQQDTPTSETLYRECYFPTYIFYVDLENGPRLNKAIIPAVYALRQQEPLGLHRSNVKQTGAWHSPDDLNRRDEYSDLVSEICRITDQVFKEMKFDPQYSAGVDNMWANISPKHAFNRSHIHPGVIYSGVYYLQTPEKCGRIFFVEPRPQNLMLKPRIDDKSDAPHNWSEVYYEPIAGRIILFPAWLVHEVEPNLADGEGDEANRISISFNLCQRKSG